MEILCDGNAYLLALVLLQHRPDIDIVLQGDRSAFAGRPRHIVEIAIAARGGLPSDIGGIIDEREEQSAAKARPEKAVDRACKPGSDECIGARRGKSDQHALRSDDRRVGKKS